MFWLPESQLAFPAILVASGLFIATVSPKGNEEAVASAKNVCKPDVSELNLSFVGRNQTRRLCLRDSAYELLKKWITDNLALFRW